LARLASPVATLYHRPVSTARREKPPATVADLLAIPESERFHEVIDGELVRKALPSAHRLPLDRRGLPARA